MPYLDMSGKKYGKLTIIEKDYSKNGTVYWKCVCDCGNEVVKSGMLIRLGKTTSCGCVKRQMLVDRNTTHGMAHSKLNMVWCEMKTRCSNSSHKRYKDYGGRGIHVDERWNNFETFYNDMNGTYSEGLTLDRIDNSKGYSKDNCRWVSQLKQNNNKRNNVYETVNGVTATRSELCDMFDIPRCSFYWNINHGMTVEQALKSPRKIKYTKRTK